MKPRLAILMQLGSPWARRAAGSLAQAGWEVHAIDFTSDRPGYLNSNDPFQSAEIQAFQAAVSATHFISSRHASSLRYFTSIPQFRKMLRSIKPSVLLATNAGGFGLLARLSGFAPFAVYAVGSDVLFARGFQSLLTRWTLAGAGRVFANGQFLAERTRALQAGARVLPLLLGVDTNLFTPGHPPTSPPVFFCNRGFKPVYNNEYIIEGLATLSQPPPFVFHFASAGADLEKVKARAVATLSPAVLQGVRFWGGVGSGKMLELMRGSHFFVSMSSSDGTATSLLEAMSCGLFPILSDIPQNREWVSGADSNGRLVPLAKPPELGDLFRWAVANPGAAAAASNFNRRRIIDRADSTSTMAVLHAELRSLAGLAPPRNSPVTPTS